MGSGYARIARNVTAGDHTNPIDRVMSPCYVASPEETYSVLRVLSAALTAATVLAAPTVAGAAPLYRRRRTGLALAALLAVAGLVAGVVGLQGPLLVNGAVLVPLTRPAVRAAAR